jgi:hypothetical protein
MDIRIIIEDIIRLTDRFYSLGDKSIYDLLKDSGYFEVNDQIQENDIADVLSQNPDLIEQWLIWSEDKRTISGWYFTEDKKTGKYVVSFYPSKSGLEKLEFSDKRLACAAFIKREIESIRGLE